jgi:ATP-dependent DNA ligase
MGGRNRHSGKPAANAAEIAIWRMGMRVSRVGPGALDMPAREARKNLLGLAGLGQHRWLRRDAHADRKQRAEAAALPNWVKPQLTKLVDQPPNGSEWLHEIKFDGYRMHARFDRDAVRLLTRTGLDWTHKYPAIASAVSSLPAGQAYLDGELCGVRPDGTTSFSLIQNASDTGRSDALVFFLFDLVHLDGEAKPLKERKEQLRAIAAKIIGELDILKDIPA